MGHFHNSIPHKTSSITSDWAFHSQEGRGRVETQIQRAEDACRRWMDRLSDFPVVWIIGISEFNRVKPCTRQSDWVHVIINAALWRTQTKGIKNMSSGRWFQEGRRTTPSPYKRPYKVDKLSDYEPRRHPIRTRTSEVICEIMWSQI